MLRIIMLAPLPAIILDLFRLLPQRAYNPVALEVLTYLIIVLLAVNRRFPYQWRIFLVLGSNLIFSSYLLVNGGLISNGRVYLLADIFIAALLLSRRSVLLIWLSSAIALTLSGISFVGRSSGDIAVLAARLSDPNTLLTNGMVTLILGAVAAIGASSLVSSLARSLRTTEEALAERDQMNATLEQRVTERTRELEQALAAFAASETKYKTLFQTLPVGVLVVDDRAQYVEHNPIARSILSLDNGDGYVRNAGELPHRTIDTDGRTVAADEYPSVRSVRTHEPIRGLELGIIRTNDEEQVTWVSTDTAPLDLPQYGAVVVLSDITSRKRAEAELRASETRLRTILQAALDGFWMVDLQGAFVDVNEAYCAMSGYSRAELLTMRIPDLEAIEQPEETAARIQRIAATGADRFESRHRRKDGSIFDVEVGVTYLASAELIVCFCRDITERKRVEAELRTSQRFIQRVTDTIPELVYVFDLVKSNVVFVNPAVVQVLGYTPEQVLAMGSKTLEILIHPDDITYVVQQLQRLASAEDDDFRLESEYRMRYADGSWRWFTARNNIFARNEQGIPLQILGVNEDITARKQAEQALEHQLAVQAAVARCSQVLLQPVSSVADQRQLLASALVAIGTVIDNGYTIVLENFDDPQDGFCARTLAGANTASGPFVPSHPASIKTSWSAAPVAMRQALESGECWGGPVADLVADYPQMLQASQAYGVRSIQNCPIFVEGKWWGTLVLNDTERERTWEPADLLPLRTTAEIIGTAIQRWQIEADLSLQLRYAEALARCSQILLRTATNDAEQQAILESALTTLRETVDVSRLYIYQPPGSGHTDTALNILVDSRVPELTRYIEPTPEQVHNAPAAMIEALNAGRWFGGPVPGRFPNNPHFQESLDQNGVQAILMVPIILNNGLWGVLSATDHVKPRDWDAPTVQLLRTAAEMLATFRQGWDATQALREREHFIQRVTEMTPDIIHVLDLTTKRSIFVNHPLANLLGYPTEQIAEISLDVLRQLTHPDDHARLAEHYARLAEDGQVAEIQVRVFLGNGEEHWFLNRDMIFARDEMGRPSQILSIAQDITESKLTAQALAASEARLRALRDALPDLLFVVRADGTFLEFYAPRNEDLRLDPATFLGQTIAAVMPPEFAAVAYPAMARVVETGVLELIEYPLQLGQGEQMFEARIARIAGDELLIVVRDITERRRTTEALLRAKEAAEAADRAKSTFLAHISHEIRTPLTAIIGMSGLLRNTDIAPHQREYVMTIQTGATTLLNLIGNILDFSKIEAGQMELNAQPFDLRACVNEALELIAHEARRKGLALESEVQATVPGVLDGDGGRLRQVLVNLLGNAVKFTERGSVALLVSGRPLSETDYELTIAISDTGIGIPADQLAHIFDPFVQADSATTRRFGGTGLGLSISKQIVELMGGQINVTSATGKGSTFTLTLPLRIAETIPDALRPGVGERETVQRRQLRILLAEDNLINQDVLRRLLENLGYTPDVASNGAEALAAVSRQPYDVVLMDIQMPELDGEEATRRIRALGSAIVQPHIIALTASALRGDRERYLAAGMDDYLSKPVQVGDLRAALNRAALPGSNTSTPAAAPPDPRPARQSAPAAASRLIDWAMVEHLIESLGMEPAQSAEMVLDLFSRALSAQLTEITQAVATDDRPQVRLLAHKLRGGSRQLGATRLADQWTTLETAAQSADEPLDAILDHARQIYDETLAQLSARLKR